ncbi:rCG45770, partial [Rattus norvegicus]
MLFFKNRALWPVVARACNPSNRVVVAEGSRSLPPALSRTFKRATPSSELVHVLSTGDT